MTDAEVLLSLLTVALVGAAAVGFTKMFLYFEWKRLFWGKRWWERVKK